MRRRTSNWRGAFGRESRGGSLGTARQMRVWLGGFMRRSKQLAALPLDRWVSMRTFGRREPTG